MPVSAQSGADTSAHSPPIRPASPPPGTMTLEGGVRAVRRILGPSQTFSQLKPPFCISPGQDPMPPLYPRNGYCALGSRPPSNRCSAQPTGRPNPPCIPPPPGVTSLYEYAPGESQYHTETIPRTHPCFQSYLESVPPMTKIIFQITKLDALVRSSHRRQFEIAGICGIHPTTLGQYVNGKKAIPAKDIVSLAKFFGVSPEEIVGYVEVEKTIKDPRRPNPS